MALYFKPLFSWKEPRAYRDMRKRLRGPEPKWFKPLCALIISAIPTVPVYSSAIMDPSYQIYDKLSIISAIMVSSFGLVYVALLLEKNFQQPIRVFQNAIQRSRALLFKNVTAYGWVPVHDFILLVLYSKQHRPLIIAVPSADVQQRVESLLIEKKVPRHSTPIDLRQLLPPAKTCYVMTLSLLGVCLLFHIILAVGMHIFTTQLDFRPTIPTRPPSRCSR